MILSRKASRYISLGRQSNPLTATIHVEAQKAGRQAHVILRNLGCAHTNLLVEDDDDHDLLFLVILH